MNKDIEYTINRAKIKIKFVSNREFPQGKNLIKKPKRTAIKILAEGPATATFASPYFL